MLFGGYLRIHVSLDYHILVNKGLYKILIIMLDYLKIIYQISKVHRALQTYRGF